MRRILLQIAVLSLATSIPEAARGQATFVELAPLTGFDGSEVGGVALDGTVVGTSFLSGGTSSEPTIWDAAGAATGLGINGGARAISRDGSTVVGSTSVSGSETAYRWTAPQGVQLLAAPGVFERANDVSADGTVVVGQGPGGALRWTAASGTQALPGTRFAHACSASGDVVVGERAPFAPFRWTAAGGVQSPWGSGYATHVSGDGDTVVGVLSGLPPNVVRWTAATGVVWLATLWALGVPDGITDDGRMIVGSAQHPQQFDRAFIWTEQGGVQWLEDWLRTRGATIPTGWALVYASHISGDGRYIVGGGWDALGQLRGWRADLLGTLGDRYCTLQARNSTRMHGVLFAAGSDVVLDNDLTLHAAHLGPFAATLFLVAPSQALVISPGGAQGNLCLGGGIGRFVQQIGVANQFGHVWRTIDLTGLPLPGGVTSVAVGETWSFQAWYRDLNPGPTSNFTDALSLTFR